MTTLTGASPFTLATDAEGAFTLTYDGEVAPPPPPPPTGGGIAPASASAIYTAYTNLSATIPADGSIPQKTEGTEVVIVTLAAKVASSKIRVQFDAYGAHTSSDNALIAALFIDDESNARRAVGVNQPGPGYATPLRFVYEWTPGDTNPHTYRVRVGTSYGAMRLNGWGTAGQLLGATAAATLMVDEVLA